MTETPDLRQGPPRRWNVELDGVAWLPRLIDKARAVRAGTLGAYLYGQSPTDTGLLRVLGMGYRSFLSLVGGAADDAAVSAALTARDPGWLARGNAWTADLRKNHKLFLWLMDLDDGYLTGGRWICPALNGATAVFTAILKKIVPVPVPEAPR